jgi:hypothetical protein
LRFYKLAQDVGTNRQAMAGLQADAMWCRAEGKKERRGLDRRWSTKKKVGHRDCGL